MPRYRIIKEVPDVIGYRNGKLYFSDYYAGGKEWVWFCRREIVAHSSVDLLRAEDAVKLDNGRKEGITVPRGSLAESVLQSLVRKGTR